MTVGTVTRGRYGNAGAKEREISLFYHFSHLKWDECKSMFTHWRWWSMLPLPETAAICYLLTITVHNSIRIFLKVVSPPDFSALVVFFVHNMYHNVWIAQVKRKFSLRNPIEKDYVTREWDLDNSLHLTHQQLSVFKMGIFIT